jgi:diketogulonate reductase-like aldo/keto reductase
MGLDYVDLYLAHWPYAAKSVSREALKNAKAGPKASPEEKGQLMKDGKPVVDWEHSSTNIAKLKGEYLTLIIFPEELFRYILVCN